MVSTNPTRQNSFIKCFTLSNIWKDTLALSGEEYMSWRKKMGNKKCLAIFIMLLLIVSLFGTAFGSAEVWDEEDIGEEVSSGEKVEGEESAGMNENYEMEKKFSSFEKDWLPEGIKNNYYGEDLHSSESDLEGSYSKTLSIPSIESFDHTERDPIRIDSDDDFEDQAEDENWPGDGSQEDPYIIEEYQIGGGDHGYAIYIGNVSDHFTVRNCVLYNSSGNNHEFFENTGLYLFNTVNGRLENNTLIDNQNGITTRSSENTVIIDNEVYMDEEESNSEPLSDRYDTHLHETSREEKDYSSDSVLVRLDLDSDLETKSIDMSESILEDKADDLSEMIGGQTLRVFPSVKGAEIQVEDEDSVLDMVRFLSHRSSVKYAEPNYQYELMGEPNDPGYDSLWGMDKIDAPGAWNVTTGSEEVVVAVLDTGIDHNHPDLKENMWTSDEGYHGYNAVNDSYYPMDDYGHGTHVAGTIGAVGNNSLGVVGVNWNVSLMGVRIGGAMGINTADVLAGMEYVLEKGREGENIVATSNSWGGGEKSQLMKEAIAEHRDEDILFVAAAGNNRRNNDEVPFYPATYDLTNIISVAATDQDDRLAPFSNYGERSVHVAAPGVDINSTILDTNYSYMSGTSMATPHVSGLAALLAAEETDFNHNQLKNALLSSTDEVEELKGKIQTDGRINASQTLQVEPDPDDVQFRVQRPLKQLLKGRDTSIIVSLDDGVNPITDAEVTVEISTRKDDFELKDDGTGGDQVANDGYYTAAWTPRVSGEIILNITAEWENEKMSEEIVVNVFGDPGIAIFESVDESIVNNTVYNYELGVSLLSSNGNTIENNNISSNGIGCDLYRSDKNTIDNNTLKGVEDGIGYGGGGGILFEESEENTVLNNDITRMSVGIFLLGSKNNHVIGNEMLENMQGVLIQGSGGNIVEENSLTENFQIGIQISESTNNTLVNNDVSGTGRSWGIILMGTSGNEIVNNSVRDHQYGISSLLSDGDLIENNELKDNVMGLNLGLLSFFFAPSDGNEVINNQMIDNEIGIYSLASNNNNITDNEIKDNADVGVMLLGIGMFGSVEGSAGNQIRDNVVESNMAGIIGLLVHDTTIIDNELSGNEEVSIMLSDSTENHIEDNTMTRGLVVLGQELEHWNTHDIDTSNTVDGSPVYYLKNEDDVKVPSDAGQVILANCADVTIEGLDINEVFGGVVIGFSDDISIANNELSQNQMGIFLWRSHNNVLTQNTISNNEFGIELGSSEDNVIYRNRFINNENHAQDDGNNEWNEEYVIEDEVIGGNYWDDHIEPDEYGGLDQDEFGSDGIVDQPRDIPGGDSVDEHPWTNPQFASPPIEISDPEPTDSAEDTSVDTALSVNVEAGTYPTEVEFYLDDTAVYTETVGETGIVETEPLDLEHDKSYEWYVEGTNDGNDNRSVSSIYSFTTEEEVEMYDLQFAVEDEDSDPIEDALVQVNGMEEITDSNGEAFFEELEPDSYEYEVTHEDYETEDGEIDIVDQDTTVTVIMEEERRDIEDIIDEIRNIPGFTSTLLLLAAITAVAIYRKKE